MAYNNLPGKIKVKVRDIETGEEHYEYLDLHPSPELAELRQQQELMQLALDDLILGGGL